MSQRVILLNGPAGVGKSTVGRQLAARAANGVCIHGDAIKDFVVTRRDGTVRQGLAYVGGARLTDMYLQAGYELVVFEFCFEHPRHITRFTDELISSVETNMLLLWAPLDVVCRRELNRPGRERLGPRVEECWETMSRQRDQLGRLVDASAPLDRVVDAAAAAAKLP